MGIAFLAKRAVGILAQPLPAVFLLAVLALLLHRFTKRKKSAFVCLVLSGLVLFASTFPPLVRWTAGFLESRHRPLLAAEPGTLRPVAIVVLGNGVANPGDAALPALTRLNDAARARLVEGVRLARVFPEARLIVTGYGMGLENCADAMAAAAIELGVAEERVTRFPQSLDTEHEAELVKEMAGDGAVAVVTTAIHMTRAMLFFEGRGVNAVAAPCDFIGPLAPESRRAVNLRRWRPRGGSLADSEEIWHEALGLLYYGLFKSGGAGD